MVISHKVSRSCENCRKRKIKCGETRPCDQCIKRGKSCSQSERFVFESIESIKNFVREHEKSEPQHPYSETFPKHPTRELVSLSTRTIELSRPSEASPTHYGLDQRELAQISFAGFLAPLKIDKEWKPYRLALEACTMAFDNLTDSHCEGETEALKKYNLALLAISAAVGDPIAANKDATLAAILLLVVFECICPITSEQAAWRDHVKAAIMLFEQRGRELVGTETERAFRAVRTQMIIHSLLTLEDHGNDQLRWFADNDTDEHIPIEKLCVDISSLGIHAKTLLNPRTDTDMAKEMLQQCLAYDQRLKQWPDNLSASDQIFKQQKADAGPNTDLERTSLWLSMLWSMQVCARLLLNSIMIRCIACIYEKFDYKNAQEYRNTQLVLRDITANIITVNGSQETRSTDLGENNALYRMQEQVLTWPLAFIWSLSCFNPDQRVAVSTMLEDAGRFIFRAAQSLQDEAERTKRIDKTKQDMKASGGTQFDENNGRIRNEFTDDECSLLCRLKEKGMTWSDIGKYHFPSRLPQALSRHYRRTCIHRRPDAA